MQIEDQEQEIMLEPELYAEVGNGTLTVQKNSTTIGTFTANQKTDTTIDITVPVATSELTNDADFQNANDLASAISQHNQSTSAHQDIRQAITDEGTARVNADNALQGQIDAITAASDVVDIVGTYAELQAYDTQHLKDNDVIKVLQDETHNDAMTYYRWSTTTETWTYIGSEGPYYTKSETNTLLDGKLDKSAVPDGFFDGAATVNPTPATSVEVQDCIKLKSVELQGDTVQNNYTGKNLLNLPDTVRTENGITWTVTGTNHAVGSGTTSSVSGSYLTGSRILIDFDITGDFTFSISEAITAPLYIRFYDNANTNLGQITIDTGSTSQTGTIPSTATKYWILLAPRANTQYDIDIYLQFEKGNQPTSIEPYTGGQPAPSPSYPQTIQSVTGTQTITVTDGDVQNVYTVDLGNIELCKIGDYQDYIYKNGDDWYVHKEIGKSVLNGSEEWVQHTYVINNINGFRLNVGAANSNGGLLANYFRPVAWSSYQASGANGRTYGTITTADSASTPNTNIYITQPDSTITDLAQFQTWLSTHNTITYYALATPTDTQITDNTLIGQLEALLRATIYQPTTTITASGTLPAILNVEAFTDNLNSILEIASQPDPEQIIYEDFVGTDGVNAGTAGLVPAPATTDAGKFLKADGTWDTAGGGGDTVYSDKTTSNSSTGGAVYIGNLDSSQVEKTDPTAVDNHYKYFWALPTGNTTIPADSSINILGDRSSQYGIVMGVGASASPSTYYSIAIGPSASTENNNASNAVAIGNAATVYSSNGIAIGRAAKVSNTTYQNSIALGSFAQVGRKGEVNIGTGGNNFGYNNTDYRVIGGVHDGQLAQDAVTVNQVNATIDAINSALGTSIPHIGA